jgi:gas vesicle protein
MADKYDREERGGSWFSGLVMGGLIGAAVALLMAPRRGEETRQMLVEKGQEVMDRANEYKGVAVDRASEYSTKAKDRAMNIAGDVSNRANQAVDQARSKANQLTNKAQDKVNTIADKAQDKLSNIQDQTQHGSVPNTGMNMDSGAHDGGITEWTEEASRDVNVSGEEARREKNILEDDIDKTYDL